MAIKGLAAIRQLQEEKKAQEEARNRPKADWFKFPKGTDSVVVRFLQELDEASPGFNPEAGVGLVEVEVDGCFRGRLNDRLEPAQ